MRAPLLALALLFLLAACSPVGSVVRPPRFALLEAGITAVDPPGLSPAPSATVSLKLRVTNPNPVGLAADEVAASLFLNGDRAAGATIPRLGLPANGTTDVTVPVAVPLSGTTLWESVLDAARGKPVAYRLEGAFSLDLGPLGRPRFGPYVLAQDTLKAAPLSPARPFF
ncbi:MAG TPA: LEA type 2 family protein, partial [Deinococcales bacterium]|nr:LEA type 2 family protein [Deinococcales bacterium]